MAAHTGAAARRSRPPPAGTVRRRRAATVAEPASGGQLDLTAPTVSNHLKALSRAGIVTSRRDGREVLYQRTPLGDQLIAAASPQ
ncbi:helix-turn-helix domain-containing protein [Actinoallomurus sp. NPDC050550]|uniref:helix-turn-helix domain-containing protein n=1 Tax=Actinoallomurus sp. NPDC050550 TaxID=3154937 RepID=UPI0033DF3BAF